jgi:hypothetical protein
LHAGGAFIDSTIACVIAGAKIVGINPTVNP